MGSSLFWMAMCRGSHPLTPRLWCHAYRSRRPLPASHRLPKTTIQRVRLSTTQPPMSAHCVPLCLCLPEVEHALYHPMVHTDSASCVVCMVTCSCCQASSVSLVCLLGCQHSGSLLVVAGEWSEWISRL